MATLLSPRQQRGAIVIKCVITWRRLRDQGANARRQAGLTMGLGRPGIGWANLNVYERMMLADGR